MPAQAWWWTYAFPLYQNLSWGFPGGLVVKNVPASPGDKGSIADPGRAHMPRSN